ncbi:hypothetical protein FRUB_03108 [Fimbriiglobus ruber]|uniref:Uncharacterized protein n=1 Tax=Fimbriiglobus ruber TaxID=1908690 RepID=A0A225E1Z8_9BACT|nr:hypothetical protein FRUB_03108 [Fimbriiglobus ruber]
MCRGKFDRDIRLATVSGDNGRPDEEFFTKSGDPGRKTACRGAAGSLRSHHTPARTRPWCRRRTTSHHRNPLHRG